MRGNVFEQEADRPRLNGRDNFIIFDKTGQGDHPRALLQGADLPRTGEECLVYRDNLYFDEPFIAAFLAELQADPRFAGLEVKYSRSAFVPFGRLRVKRKAEIITYRDPSLRPDEGRAPSVAPETLARWLAQGHDDDGREVALLDTRNAEEVEYGTFRGALNFGITRFTELPQAIAERREALAGKTVVSFCTGGIRCEKSVLGMQAEGYAHCYQLEGGILGYFEKVGGAHYDGRCFVFDDRIALDPQLQPLIADPGF